MAVPLCVLILEDREEDAELMVAELHQAGYSPNWQRVETESSFAARVRPEVQMILADYNLPEMDALQALAILQESGLDIPFIVVTGSISEEVAVACIKQGAADYLLKDRLARLGPAVAHALEQKRLRDGQRQAEDALRESEERFRMLVESLQDYAMFALDPMGRIVSWNIGAERIFGYRAEEILGQSVDRFCQSEDVESGLLERVLRQTAQEGRFHDESWRLRQDGTRFWADTVRTALRDETGRLRGFSCLTRDMTERREAEAERRRLEAQVQHAQKLESLGIMAGGVAHDFNNLLTSILGNLSLALPEVPPESSARVALERTETAAMRAAELTRQMLIYSGKADSLIQPVQLSSVVEEMAGLLQTVISKKASLQFAFAPQIPQVQADPTQIRQIVMNLITNASEALDAEGGDIILRTGHLEADRGYLTSTYLSNDLPEGVYVFLEVADTGCGMDEATRAKIFDPFFTTKFIGRGLGLATVLGLVRKHRGAIKIRSAPGEGATFTVLLPCVAGTSPVPVVETPTPSTEWPLTGTILVVDDEEPIRDVARKILERAGFRVLLAQDGVEGLEIYRLQGRDITATLLDLTMPRMGAPEVFRELRLLRPDARVVLMSGYDMHDVKRQFADQGLAGFVQKPFRGSDLLAALRRSLEPAPG